MYYFVCAKEFGWTPEQTDKVDIKKINIMLTFLEKVREREANELKNG